MIELKINGSVFTTTNAEDAKKVLDALSVPQQSQKRFGFFGKKIKKHNKRHWSKTEEEILKQNMDVVPNTAIELALHRTSGSVSAKKHRVKRRINSTTGKVSYLIPWTKEEINMLKGIKTRQELLNSSAYKFLLQRRTAGAIITKWYSTNK